MWYVSAMLFASIIIYFFAVKNRKRFILFIAPAVTFILYSWFYQTNHGMQGVGLKTRAFIVGDGLWRAIAGMMFGCIIYAIYDYLNKKGIEKRMNKPVRIILSVVELGIIGLICVMFHGPGQTVKDFTMIALMGVLVISTMLGGSYLTKALNRIPINGKYTYALYCHHWLFQRLIKEYFPDHPFYLMLVIFLAVSFGVSVLSTLFTDWLGKTVHKFKAKQAV